MPFQALLDGIARADDGVEAALLLDGTGEMVMAAGAWSDRQLLIGAYHGVVLSAARRASERHGGGTLESLTWRYSEGIVVVRPLKDGYYLVACSRDPRRAPRLVHRTAAVQERMNEEL